jgi:BASS family bile acid:Na+ symporter
MTRLLALFTNLFPVWVLVGGVLALWHPPLVTWFGGDLIVWSLALVMLGMGVTLGLEDFRRVLRLPRAVAAGFVAQYLIMPLLGYGIAWALELEASLAVGLILVACCPGGTASNIVTFLASANVALSVLMTMCSTVAAVLMTPLLTSVLAGALIEVDAVGIVKSTAQVVLLPVALGVGLNTFSPRLVRVVLPVAPLVSVLAVAMICASIIGKNAELILGSGSTLLGAVFLLHAAGFALGWLFARVLGFDAQVCRTISIEVGMQNSGLGVVLAQRHFPGSAASVPAAISSVFHSVIGSLLAWVWSRRPTTKIEGTAIMSPGGNPG